MYLSPQVGVINFSPYFMDYINTVIDCADPTAKPHIVTVTCPEDILASGKITRNQEGGKEGKDDDSKAPLKIWDPQQKVGTCTVLPSPHPYNHFALSPPSPHPPSPAPSTSLSLTPSLTVLQRY